LVWGWRGGDWGVGEIMMMIIRITLAAIIITIAILIPIPFGQFSHFLNNP
jgi:hypothetical protein